ncbi:MAG TPA: tetratricopeptide repeat protein, partial [Thermoplasmata archaeon]|nr:tetratricopeptide repeat protein [Thermoplasmata archaeon]
IASETKRSLFFHLFSVDGVSRDTARALSETFVTEERLRAADLEAIAHVPGVPPEQAALVRDSFSVGTPPPRRDLREKAEELLEAGQAEEALEVFDELVRLAPEDVEAWLNRGEVLAILGRPEEAIGSYERVLELESHHKAARGELANLLFERGEFGTAAAHLQDLLSQSPDQVDDWLARAGTLLAQGKATEATLIYNAVLEGDPQNLIASLALGDLLLAMGDSETADREYTRALQHHPDDPDALLKKGLLLNRQGRWGAAIQMFNRAISVRWDHRDAWAAKGQVLLAQGKPKEALECFDKLLTFDARRHDGWIGKAEAHLALGENDHAAEAAGRALALDEGNQDVQALLERLRESAERPHDAIEASSLPPVGAFDAGVLVEMADTLLDAGDPDSALRGYNEVLSQNLKDARAWYGKGRALHALERYGEAVRCLTAAVEFEPANEEYARWLAVCEERWRKETQ